MARKINWAELGVILSRLEPAWAIVGWALSFLIIVGLTLRWRILLLQQGIPVSARTVFALTWAGQFFNSILPGSTGGDVMKIYQLCRIFPDRKAAAVATVFVDRLMAFLALLGLGLCGFILEPVPLRLLIKDATRLTPLTAMLALCAVIITAGVLSWLLYRVLRNSPWLGRLQRTFAAARTNVIFGPKLVTVLALAFAVHFINFFVAYLFARSLGIVITYPQILLMMPVILFLVMLPVTINGHGLRELLLITYFTHMGIGLGDGSATGVREIAVAFSLLLVSNDLVWSMWGGLWYMMRFRAREA